MGGMRPYTIIKCNNYKRSRIIILNIAFITVLENVPIILIYYNDLRLNLRENLDNNKIRIVREVFVE